MKRILLIDDEADLVTVFKVILENSGYQVITATGGVEGLKKAVEETPDLILLDMAMPKKDEPSTLRELKENNLTKRIPVIMLTASIVTLAGREQCLRLGAADYIFKTCDTEALLLCLKQHLS